MWDLSGKYVNHKPGLGEKKKTFGELLTIGW